MIGWVTEDMLLSSPKRKNIGWLRGEIMEIYTHIYNGLRVATGDVLCTHDGDENSAFGRIWRYMGLLVPGEIDHTLVYVGPGGRCVESGAKGVIAFEMPGEAWEAQSLYSQRWLADSLVGAAYPLQGLHLAPREEERIRLGVAEYCLRQVECARPYNPNFLDAQREGAFYCSQLIYKAYLAQGIDLNKDAGVPAGILSKVVFPQEIWNGCVHRRVAPVLA
jgi:hypothetical protein